MTTMNLEKELKLLGKIRGLDQDERHSGKHPHNALFPR